MTREEGPLIEEARVLLYPDSPPPDLDTALRVSKQLKRKQDFGRARRVLKRARDHPSLTSERNRLKVSQLVQQHALCHSKDASLPYRRHEEALGFLEEGADLKSTTDKETLGIAGGILKRMWARSGQSRYLTQGLNCYERGYLSPDSSDDYGYNGINAAFLNDQLAAEDDPRTALERCRNAQEIREVLVGRLPALRVQEAWLGDQWWYLVTVAEALLGLHRYSDASQWLRDAHAVNVDDWEKQATATQLAELCRLHGRLGANLPAVIVSVPTSPHAEAADASSPALEVVRSAFPKVPITDLGLKMGLALSGGGFRASFYHLGVLARLADEDQLRRVEVLSCVSGGSIVGAHYYLEMRALLERTADEQITKEDYIRVVRQAGDRFLAGVQRNLRTRVLASPRASLAVLFGDQTRTKYLGDLFESEIYAHVDDDHPKDQARWLNELLIQPLGESESFHPRDHNWRRQAKVPVLILNATTLNTGHLWQFTAAWMGEPPAPINPLIDLRERLRRLYYGDAPEAFQRVRLGHAVAASACVPGLFEPLELDGLYPNRKVRLVDGGVFDNQGVEGLLGEECQDVVVSDASGPLTAEAVVAASRIGVPVRSNAISMNLVRDRQYQSLRGLLEASSLRRFFWVHLAQGAIGGSTVDWDGCRDPSATHLAEPRPRNIIDERISAIRTDLDSFSEAEAYVLMTNGYRMIERALDRSRPRGQSAPPAGPWPFLSIEPIMERKPGYERAHQRLLVLLGASSQTLFKLWRIVPGLTPATALLGFLIVVALLFQAWRQPGSIPAIGVRTLVGALLAVVAGGLSLGLCRRLIRTQASLGRVAVTVLALVAWIPARLQLHLLDRWFLMLGKVDRLSRR
jgi:predicted acylesterase/phospholipase RssA